MNHIIDFPIRTGDRPEDVNLHAFFKTTEAALERCCEIIAAPLQSLTYEQLVLVSERAAEWGTACSYNQLVRDLICDEFSRRPDDEDPSNHPQTDGAA